MVLSLTCAVQNYDWGIKGTSEVSALGELNTGVASIRPSRTPSFGWGRTPAVRPR